MKIRLKNVRLSFPALFEPEAFEEGSTPKFQATFILDKKIHAATIKEIEAAIAATLKEKWGTKLPGGLKSRFHDGSKKDHLDGYGEGVMFFCATSEKRIPVVDADKAPLSASDGKPYAGCYVNATVNTAIQDNKFGRAVNFYLVAVQYSKKGEPFGAGSADPDEEFDDVSADEDSDGL